MNYSEEEKEAIEYWKRDIKLYHYNTQLASEYYAQILLNLIQKQEKIIDKMAEYMSINGVEVDICPYEKSKNCDERCKECIKKYFKKEVEEDE